MKVDCTLLNLDVNDLITDFSSNQFDSNMTIPNIKEKLCHLLYFFLCLSHTLGVGLGGGVGWANNVLALAHLVSFFLCLRQKNFFTLHAMLCCFPLCFLYNFELR